VTTEYTVGVRPQTRSEALTIEAEDALIAALRAKPRASRSGHLRMNHSRRDAINREPTLPGLPANRTCRGHGRIDVIDPLRTCAVFVPALGSRKDHRTATLRVCFHALQLTKRIERANRNQFEAHEVGLSQR
jgi:hypothetical protein